MGKGFFEDRHFRCDDCIVHELVFVKKRTRTNMDVATSKYNIAGLKEAQGELEEARSLFLECEQIYANVLGVDHEETLDAAMRAQTVGEEDKEESEEGEEDTDDVGLSDTS